MIHLTKRLQAVFDLVPPNYHTAIADIGTDHGYIAAALIASGKAKKVIAGDVHKAPLASAEKFIMQAGFANRIDCRLGNGLQILQPEEAQTVIIGGMGGFLMVELLEAAPYLPHTLILQPQNGQGELRQLLCNIGYVCIQEHLVKDMGHIYDAWHYERVEKIAGHTTSENAYSIYPADDLRWIYGIVTVKTHYALWKERVQRRIRQLKNVLQQMGESQKQTEAYMAKESLLKKLEEYYDYYSRDDRQDC